MSIRLTLVNSDDQVVTQPATPAPARASRSEQPRTPSSARSAVMPPTSTRLRSPRQREGADREEPIPARLRDRGVGLRERVDPPVDRGLDVVDVGQFEEGFSLLVRGGTRRGALATTRPRRLRQADGSLGGR